MTAAVLITGNTYPVREQIKALGGRWDAGAKGWRVPEAAAAKARALVDAPAPAPPAAAAPRQRRAATPRAAKRVLGAGEETIFRPSTGRHDQGYQDGEIVCHRDGRYLIVVTPQGRYCVGQEDDAHEGEWRCVAIARTATAEESAERRTAVAAAAAAKAAAEELAAALQAMPSLDRGATLPAWATTAAVERRLPKTSISSITIYRAPEGIATHEPIYDDDPLIRVAVVGTAAHDRAVAALGG